MDQCALDVPAQEHILEILEQQPAIEPVISRGKTATGDRADEIDLVEHVRRFTLELDLRVPHSLQYTVGHGCSTCTAAGEGH